MYLGHEEELVTKHYLHTALARIERDLVILKWMLGAISP